MGRAVHSSYPSNVDGRRRPRQPYERSLARRESAESRRANWKTLVLRAYAATGNVTRACKQVGIETATFYKARREDPEFAEAYEHAHRAATDKVLEAVWQMGVDGEREPIVWQGEIVAYRRVRSFPAAKFLLESMAPEQYSSRERVARMGMRSAQEIADAQRKMLEQVGDRLAAFGRPSPAELPPPIEDATVIPDDLDDSTDEERPDD